MRLSSVISAILANMPIAVATKYFLLFFIWQTLLLVQADQLLDWNIQQLHVGKQRRYILFDELAALQFQRVLISGLRQKIADTTLRRENVVILQITQRLDHGVRID